MAPRVSTRRPILLGTVCVVLAVVAGFSFGSDLVLRRRAASLLFDLGLGAQPAIVESFALCERGDLAAAFATESALVELAPGATSGGVSARYETRGRAALTAARDLAAAAVAERPGSALHRFALGRAGYALWDLEARPQPAETRAWLEAFRMAGTGAPGLDLIWATASDACIAAWPRLSEADREEAVPTVQRAFLSAGYVRQAFPGAWRVLGARAAELLPDSADCLKEGAAALRAMGQPDAAERLEARRTRIVANLNE
jgi:hypothetical protein